MNPLPCVEVYKKNYFKAVFVRMLGVVLAFGVGNISAQESPPLDIPEEVLNEVPALPEELKLPGEENAFKEEKEQTISKQAPPSTEIRKETPVSTPTPPSTPETETFFSAGRDFFPLRVGEKRTYRVLKAKPGEKQPEEQHWVLESLEQKEKSVFEAVWRIEKDGETRRISLVADGAGVQEKETGIFWLKVPEKGARQWEQKVGGILEKCSASLGAVTIFGKVYPDALTVGCKNATGRTYRYFSKNLGLIRTERYDAQGRLIQPESYDLQQKDTDH